MNSSCYAISWCMWISIFDIFFLCGISLFSFSIRDRFGFNNDILCSCYGCCFFFFSVLFFRDKFKSLFRFLCINCKIQCAIKLYLFIFDAGVWCVVVDTCVRANRRKENRNVINVTSIEAPKRIVFRFVKLKVNWYYFAYFLLAPFNMWYDYVVSTVKFFNWTQCDCVANSRRRRRRRRRRKKSEMFESMRFISTDTH